MLEKIEVWLSKRHTPLFRAFLVWIIVFGFLPLPVKAKDISLYQVEPSIHFIPITLDKVLQPSTEDITTSHVKINLQPLPPPTPLAPDTKPVVSRTIKPLVVPTQSSRSVLASTGTLPTVLIRIRHCEGKDNYTSQNKYSTASGAYQFIDGTWNNYGGYSKAKFAPPEVQDAKALAEYQSSGTAPWNASKSCWQ